MAARKTYIVQMEVVPGQTRNPQLDQVLKIIEDDLNELAAQSNTAGVSSVTDTVQGVGDLIFTGAGVAQSPDGKTFAFSGAGGSGTVTSLTATAPIVAAPSPITGVGVLSHQASGVTPGTYTNPTIVVDATGHVDSAVSNTLPVSTVHAFGHTITAGAADLHMQQISPGDSIQTLPQLIGGTDRGILAFISNVSGGNITLPAAAGNTIGGIAPSVVVANNAGIILIGLAGGASLGTWTYVSTA